MARVSLIQREVPEGPELYTIKAVNTIKDMLEATLNNLGGYTKVIGHPSSIIIKPNLVEVPFRTAKGSVLTDPRILEALISLLKDYGVPDIIVAEGRSVNLKHAESSTIEAFQNSGLGDAVRRAGGRLIGWDVEPFVTTEVPNGEVFSEVRVPKSILESDYFINVPKLKTHCQTEITVAIKSMQGVFDVADKILFHNEAFPWKMVDMIKAVKPNLNIVDGIIAGEGYGPIYTTPVEMNVVIASEDLVATDVVSGLVMGIDPIEVPITRLAAAEGLGEGDINKIQIVGQAIKDVAKDFERATTWNPIGLHKHIKVFAGCACRFELAQIGAAIKRLGFEGTLDDLREDVCLIVGGRAPVPKQPYKNVIIIGDEATDHPWYGAHPFIPGCPPLPSVQIVHAIEAFIHTQQPK